MSTENEGKDQPAPDTSGSGEEGFQGEVVLFDSIDQHPADQPASAQSEAAGSDVPPPEPAPAPVRRKRGPRKQKQSVPTDDAGAQAADATPDANSAVPATEQADPWWPSEDDVESPEWHLVDRVTGETRVTGLFDEVLVIALRGRKQGEQLDVVAPDGRAVVPVAIEGRLAVAARHARKWSVELQMGGVKEVLKVGTFRECVPVFEKHEKEHKSGTLVFHDPSGGVYIQCLRPMFRTTVYTKEDRDRIEIDEESYKKYLEDGDPAPQPAPAPAAPALTQAAPLPSGDASRTALAAVPTEVDSASDLLFEVEVLGAILLRERRERIAKAADRRTSLEQMLRLRGLLPAVEKP